MKRIKLKENHHRNFINREKSIVVENLGTHLKMDEVLVPSIMNSSNWSDNMVKSET